jgi:hypothetical protein
MLPGYPTALDLRLDAIVSADPDKRDLSWITPDVHSKVIVRLREAVQDEDWENWATAGLLAMEDADTINKLINQWRTLPEVGSERGAVLDILVKNTPTAVLLPLLAQHLDDIRIYSYGGSEAVSSFKWNRGCVRVLVRKGGGDETNPRTCNHTNTSRAKKDPKSKSFASREWAPPRSAC